MSLKHGKSQKAFEHNIKAEMHAGKPQPQALAIAYSVKRRAKKAKGGDIKGVHEADKGHKRGPSYAGQLIRDGKQPYANRAAKEEHLQNLEDLRSMPAPKLKGLAEGGEVPAEDQMNQRPGKQPIKYPKIMKGGTFTTKLRDQEDDLEQSDAPASPEEQPMAEYDEEMASEEGPMLHDMEDEHSNGRKPYAKGGDIQPHHPGPSKSEHQKIYDAKRQAQEEAHLRSPEGNAERTRKNAERLKQYAEGGEVEEDHHDSIAAAIMAKRDREKSMPCADSESDIDEQMYMAEGGEINGMDSIDAHPKASQADLSRNAEEDANMEDQSSFDALRKENYSESEGLDALDQPHDSNLEGDSREDEAEDIHDMVSKIRSKMNMKRQFAEGGGVHSAEPAHHFFDKKGYRDKGVSVAGALIRAPESYKDLEDAKLIHKEKLEELKRRK